MRHLTARLLWSATLALVGVGCAGVAGTVPASDYALAPEPPPGVSPSVALAMDHAAFFHPECPRSEIQVSRVSADRRFAELVVCGKTRRYQDIAPVIYGDAAPKAPTWIEITPAVG